MKKTPAELQAEIKALKANIARYDLRAGEPMTLVVG